MRRPGQCWLQVFNFCSQYKNAVVCNNNDDSMTSQIFDQSKVVEYILQQKQRFTHQNQRMTTNLTKKSSTIKQGSKKNSQLLLDKLIDFKKSISNGSQVVNPNLTDNIQSEEESLKSFITVGSQEEIDNISSKSKKPLSKIEDIRSKTIGLRTIIPSPFSFDIEAVYADHTATHRPYQKIEDVIQYAKTMAANPHTQFSHFGKYSTEMMNYAQSSLLQSFSADPERYVALPSGSGCTGAIQKTLKILKSLKDIGSTSVYLTPYQHHSNILPWVQYYQKVNILPCNEEGDLIMNEIEDSLNSDESEFIIISVSATSNVTSKITKLTELNQIIRNVRNRKRIVLCLDCAAYCTHKHLNLQKLEQVDFVFTSPHKNLGGSQSCGVLIGRKAIIQLSKPTFPGGGTVKFVKGYSKEDIMYEDNIFARQISGTPPFLGFYRAALSFELLNKDITYTFIQQKEKENTSLFLRIIKEANQRFKAQHKDIRIVLYGDDDFEKRGNVITLNILNGKDLINHNLVSTILTDLFGIQIRSGCFCAGPFGIRLLQLSNEDIEELEGQVSIGILKNKPGYCRLDLAFYFLPFQIEYLAHAIAMVAEYGHKLSLLYTICNDGEIKRLTYMSQIKYIYSLASLVEIKEKEEQRYKLLSEDRQIVLSKQLLRAEEILKNPVKFLKSLKK